MSLPPTIHTHPEDELNELQCELAILHALMNAVSGLVEEHFSGTDLPVDKSAQRSLISISGEVRRRLQDAYERTGAFFDAFDKEEVAPDAPSHVHAREEVAHG